MSLQPNHWVVNQGAALLGDRHLAWDDSFNVRDLGGFPVAGGGRTRRGALVRADGLNRLTAAGWAALWGHGVRTVIDLRNDDEVAATADAVPRPAALATIRVPLDDSADTAFWRYC